MALVANRGGCGCEHGRRERFEVLRGVGRSGGGVIGVDISDLCLVRRWQQLTGR